MINLTEPNCTRLAEKASTPLKVLSVYFMVQIHLNTARISQDIFILSNTCRNVHKPHSTGPAVYTAGGHERGQLLFLSTLNHLPQSEHSALFRRERYEHC